MRAARYIIGIAVAVVTAVLALFATGAIKLPEPTVFTDAYGDTYERDGDAYRVEYAEGDVFTGVLSGGRFDGEGSFVSASGWSFAGVFGGGVSGGEFTDSDGGVYVGGELCLQRGRKIRGGDVVKVAGGGTLVVKER